MIRVAHKKHQMLQTLAWQRLHFNHHAYLKDQEIEASLEEAISQSMKA
jgi:hypothetical protein